MRPPILGLLACLVVACIEVGHEAETGCFVDPSEPACRASGGGGGQAGTSSGSGGTAGTLSNGGAGDGSGDAGAGGEAG